MMILLLVIARLGASEQGVTENGSYVSPTPVNDNQCDELDDKRGPHRQRPVAMCRPRMAEEPIGAYPLVGI